MFTRRLLLCLGLFAFLNAYAQTTLTRSQVLGLIAAGNKAKNNGEEEVALEKYKAVIDAYPNYALPYRLTAQIYDGKEDSTSISTAIVLYRKYVQLELDDDSREEAAKTLKALEDKIRAPHYEEYADSATYKSAEAQEMEEALQEEKTAEPVRKISMSNAAKEADKRPSKEKKIAKDLTLTPTAPERTPTQVEKPADKILTGMIAGRWVSDHRMPSGKEAWILDIKAPDGTPQVTLVESSGVLNTKMESLSRQGSAVTPITMQAFPKMARTTGGKIDAAKGFTFTFQGQYEHHASTSKWNVISSYMKGIASTLPFVESLVGSNAEQSALQNKDHALQVSFDFHLRPTGCGMQGNMQERITVSGKNLPDGEKKVDRAYTFYRVDDKYTGFTLKRQKSAERQLEERRAIGRIEAIPNNADRLYCQAIAKCYGLSNDYISEYNPAKGLEQIKKAANAGHKEAMKLLAEQYYRYTVTEGMNSKKGSIYKRQADAIITQLTEYAYTEGKTLQANCLYIYGSQKDPQLSEKAVNLYREVAEKGYLPAIVRLGSIYASSNNTETMQQGRELLTQASEKGSGEAELHLAKLALKQNKIQDYTTHLNKAIHMGCVDALKELSQAYRMGYGVKQDIRKANQYHNDYYQEQSKTWKDLIGSYIKLE